MLGDIFRPLKQFAFISAAFMIPLGMAADELALEERFTDPPQEAKPWTIWYWLKGAASEAGITADLESMAANGIAGAYLMPLISPDEENFWEPPVQTLSDEYWAMVRHAMAEADRLDLDLGLHVGPGFSLAGGPWITPELSMQRVVWSETAVNGGRQFEGVLQQPPTREDYYRDIAVFAIPDHRDHASGADQFEPVVTSSFDEDVSRLADQLNEETFRGSEPGSITYTYPQAVTVRSIVVRPTGRAVQGLRLRLEVSDDGAKFEPLMQFSPPRHGWQDVGQSSVKDFTFSVPEVKARYFRFVYDPTGSEPGAEDLDSAKWSPSLKLLGIHLSSAPRLHQFEGKSAAAWRIAEWTGNTRLPDSLAVALDDVIDLSDRLEADGTLRWDVPEGRWIILRIGHTSTGATNYTGGAGEGLEADKLNPEAIKLQFDSWFAETARQVGPDLFSRVVKIFHSDSWEAESQNWSPVLPEEFKRRRGYELEPFLPVMAGVPLESVEASEQFLYDLRRTIAELVDDHYFGTLSELAHGYGAQFSSESVAPTMVSDNLRHHGTVDLPMGEFWLRSPTHDKPLDMRDAVSGAHIYGKPIVQAEAFTQLRIAWDEVPHNLKAWGDLHFALGVNRFVFHVSMLTPWLDRQPGVSLNGVGLFFQRGQTWWEQGRAWLDYITRTQAMHQAGRPVADVAVFAGEELPSRSVLPDRLLPTLPGLFGVDRVAAEAERLANGGLPLREQPKGVKSSANSSDLGDWIDPLRGYAYDSLNLDVLLNHAEVRDGRLHLDGGMDYGVLVVPGNRRLNPSGGDRMSVELMRQLVKFAAGGLPIVLESAPDRPLRKGESPETLQASIRALLKSPSVHVGAWSHPTLDAFGLKRDFEATDLSGKTNEAFAWSHRINGEEEFYYISNQEAMTRDVRFSFRVSGRIPEVWDPVSGERRVLAQWETDDGRTSFPLRFAPHESLFIVFRKPTSETAVHEGFNIIEPVPHQRLDGPWTLTLPGREEPVVYKRYLDSWSEHEDSFVRHFSGTGTYSQTFEFDPAVAEGRVWLDLGEVADVAEVFLNGEQAGVVWTAPWRLEVGELLLPGENEIRIEVTNTWANQLIADQERPADERKLWTNAPFRLEGDPLLKAGLIGPVVIMCEVPGRPPSTPVIPFPDELMENGRDVSPADMKRVYKELKTLHKYGVVLKGAEGELLDCPNVFRFGDKWYMMFVGITDGLGYQTFLAESDDLLNWTRLGAILPFSENGWDKWQGDGGVALMDYEWGGSAELQRYEGKYWMTYIGGSMKGYETDPLSAGVAWTEAPNLLEPWTRMNGNPVLSPNQPYTRPFEAKTVYKSHIIHDPEERLGWPFVMYYNGKEARGGGHEAIGMAVSRDMQRWHRFGEDRVVYNGADAQWSISGDPQIVKMGDLWVMIYFGAFWKPGAFDTFAASYDMVNWTKWEGPDLVSPSEPFDKQFAHKPWVIKHDGVVYHYYCAVGEEGRVIALATSKGLSAEDAP